MTSGGHRAVLEVLTTSIGATDVAMASAGVVRSATGQAIGGVAPVGHPTRLRTFLDETLQAHDTLWAAAGHPHTVMPLTFDQLRLITDGTIIAVA